MTPDGNPIIGEMPSLEGYINAVGMCGQGFMLGPGLGELIARLINKKLNKNDDKILHDFSLNRKYDEIEKLKWISDKRFYIVQIIQYKEKLR